MNSTSCVVVTYNPKIKSFLEVLDSISIQCDSIYIVDNSDADFSHALPKIENLEYIHLNKNIGISAAQNIGIHKAMEKKQGFIWLSDQDTLYPPSYLTDMLAMFENKSLTRVASVAPAYFDVNKNGIQDFINHGPFTQRLTPKPGVNLISHAIASGMIIPTEVLKVVGPMQEDLFIDWVDLEWCWRAKYRFGYQNIGNGNVVIKHTMGDNSVAFLGKKVSFRGATRHYYMIRNAFHLALHSRSAGPAIRVEIFFKALAWTIIFPLLASEDRSKHFNATLRGMWDGIRNKLGPMKS
ncbi:glycosyltransferase family 2 protein [Variovorax sp. HJSM1_2]|uniref:glycosyltransferase family 2 protein n=1 Tax=Variovorax sp. HJSM1_2 TaxID=3366263 RepID=UPI003BD2E703